MNIEIPDLLGFVRRAGSLSPKQNKPQRIASNRIESNQIEKHDNPIDSSANHLNELIYFGVETIVNTAKRLELFQVYLEISRAMIDLI